LKGGIDMNYYTTLGISPAATTDEVRQAYLSLAKRFHPDKNKSADATKLMAEINLAYETLCDSGRRKEYDLKNGIAVMQDEPVVEQHSEEEMEQEKPSSVFGRCIRCNFVDNSGVFVCSVCGNVFDPMGKSARKTDYDSFDSEFRKATQYYENNDVSFGEPETDESMQDSLSEIIRCPQCNEINKYSSGSCWQCGLQFETDEAA
jgi:DnaJ-class molecular chaperone